jgi:hypothetical protein
VAEPITVRKSPCPSCPYRLDVPSGVWHPDEYALLATYDGDMLAQAQARVFGLFFCHQADGNLCAGWAGCHDMRATLAARVSAGDLDPSVFAYESPVPLFGSGTEAAAHGMRDAEKPGPEALAMIRKIVRVRALRGRPVVTESATADLATQLTEWIKAEGITGHYPPDQIASRVVASIHHSRLAGWLAQGGTDYLRDMCARIKDEADLTDAQFCHEHAHH